MTTPTVTTFVNDEHLAICIRHSSEYRSRSVNIAFLIDVSHSMEEDKRLNRVKQTLRAARALWAPADRVTLVTFSRVATVHCDHLVMDTDGIDRLYSALEALETESSTNLGDGLECIQRLQREADPFDTVVLLTDGNITSGLLRTNRSLCEVSASVWSLRGDCCRTPFNVLGYGADHNRRLLRDLVVFSRGTYTYVDNDELLPVAMGDILSGARAEVFRGATIDASGSDWICQTDSSSGPYVLGSIIPDRDYWVLYKRAEAAATADDEFVTLVLYTDAGHSTTVRHRICPAPDSSATILDQVFYTRLTHALVAASDGLEADGHWNHAPITALLADIAALPAEQKARPKLLAVREQAEEMLTLSHPPATQHLPTDIPLSPSQLTYGDPMMHIAARMSSAAAIHMTQRGVRMTSGSGPGSGSGDPIAISTFSSPLQRGVSSQMYCEYSSQSC